MAQSLEEIIKALRDAAGSLEDNMTREEAQAVAEKALSEVLPIKGMGKTIKPKSADQAPVEDAEAESEDEDAEETSEEPTDAESADEETSDGDK